MTAQAELSVYGLSTCNTGVYEIIIECIPDHRQITHREIWSRFVRRIKNRSDTPSRIKTLFSPYLKYSTPPGIFEDYLEDMYNSGILQGPGTSTYPVRPGPEEE